MKITKKQLKQIIREEKQHIEESRIPGRVQGSSKPAYNAAHEAINELIREFADTYVPDELNDAKLDARNSDVGWGPDAAIFWILEAAGMMQK